MKYQVKITYSTGLVAYLSHKDRTAWSKRTAQQHATEFVVAHGRPVNGVHPFMVTLEEA